MRRPQNIDEYILDFEQPVLIRLEKVRAAIRAAAPDAAEIISYGMPAFYLHSNLVYFAGYARHIGFYPGAQAIIDFKKEIASYQWAKGSIQFPHDRPLPIALIKKITRSRVKANVEKMRAKQKRVCASGHVYYKSSDCPVCPVCEKNRLSGKGFIPGLSAPAKRALENKGISTLKQLSKYSEKQLLALHGIGPSALPIITRALKTTGLALKA